MKTYNTYARQAIETHVLPATNTLPTRIKASCERGSITVDTPNNLSGSDCHAYAAKALLARFAREDAGRSSWGELKDYAVGGTKTGYVFVNART